MKNIYCVLLLFFILILFIFSLKKEKLIKDKSICFVSGYIGKTKGIHIPNSIPNYDNYFITNNYLLKNEIIKKGWKYIFFNLELKNLGKIENEVQNSYYSKFLKVTPQNFIKKKYNFYVWFDSKWNLNYNTILKIINKWNNNYILGITKHQYGIYNTNEEFNAAILQKRYLSQKKKMLNYINLDINKNLKYNGHYQTGNIIWNMNNPLTVQFQNEWLNHINIAGIECQISFNTLIKYNKYRNNIKSIPISLVKV